MARETVDTFHARFLHDMGDFLEIVQTNASRNQSPGEDRNSDTEVSLA